MHGYSVLAVCGYSVWMCVVVGLSVCDCECGCVVEELCVVVAVGFGVCGCGFGVCCFGVWVYVVVGFEC